MPRPTVHCCSSTKHVDILYKCVGRWVVLVWHPDFFEKTQKSLRFISLNRKRTAVQVQPPRRRDTRTHTIVLTRQAGEEVLPTTDRNNERSSLVQPPTMNGKVARHRASRPRHSRCQAPPKKTASPGLTGPTYLPPICA